MAKKVTRYFRGYGPGSKEGGAEGLGFEAIKFEASDSSFKKIAELSDTLAKGIAAFGGPAIESRDLRDGFVAVMEKAQYVKAALDAGIKEEKVVTEVAGASLGDM